MMTMMMILQLVACVRSRSSSVKSEESVDLIALPGYDTWKKWYGARRQKGRVFHVVQFDSINDRST